jgi:dipeptidyl aminopeptidase/acylaminoacyl peptidase
MEHPQQAPYGSWRSPITSDLIVSESIGLGAIAIDDDSLYWTEMRPADRGRYVIVRRGPDGKTTDITPPPFSARTRVHEYGGGAYTVANGIVYFSNFADQRLYRVDPGAEPRPLTPPLDLRYADGIVDLSHNRLICVREDHTEGTQEAVSTIVAVDLDGKTEDRVLVEGADFYSSPRLSPDGKQLAWLCWHHPNMPWDGSELWLAKIADDGSLSGRTLVAGGISESIFQPEWSPDGGLHFVSDRTGWWNLYRIRNSKVESLCPLHAEFGLPQWVFGMRTYGFASSSQIVCVVTREGISELATLDTVSGKLETIETPYKRIDGIRVARGKAFFTAASLFESTAIINLDLETREAQVVKRSTELKIESGYISRPEAIEFPTGGGLTAFAFFYPPKNKDFVGREGELPPLLVMSHGGPTAARAQSSVSAFNTGRAAALRWSMLTMAEVPAMAEPIGKDSMANGVSWMSMIARTRRSTSSTEASSTASDWQSPVAVRAAIPLFVHSPFAMCSKREQATSVSAISRRSRSILTSSNRDTLTG